MSRPTEWTLDPATHNRIYADEVFPKSGFDQTTPQERPRAIVLAGQPGAGKGGLVKTAEKEFAGNVVTLDLDEKRRFHEHYKHLREAHPYTWASHTHQDARGWTNKLNHAFVEGRRNIVFDTTLGGADHWIGEMKKMQALPTHPYEVEVRVLATHCLESEHSVHSVSLAPR
ncbi:MULTISPECIES: zeta toxin family protein [unclassified Variovorax]|uniref:zeta toxin family protein n=1 Tax=unclassified Variovorax TaxID=663243 RepID=UPI00257535B1|nr:MULTISPECIES: zeta toxin family protein [unclassified Variovorax]MDM0086972.1 zeta toxin family protein [Variovorax sp. J22G40]MDM0144771.1 zeta toxin family protein [Variovorax sp. J2P1-31]